MIEDVTYIINSHIKYKEPLHILLRSMSYIPKDRIVIVLAGADTNKTFTTQDYITYGVDHNSFDYTGAIALYDHTIHTAPYVFFLQDTMEVGMNTDYFIRKARTDVPAVAAFGGQCNLVLYKRDYLDHHKNFILARRNLSKHESVHYEGMLWHLSAELASYPHATMKVLGSGNPYNGAERIKEYYDAIDLIKWKANYGQNMSAMILHP